MNAMNQLCCCSAAAAGPCTHHSTDAYTPIRLSISAGTTDCQHGAHRCLIAPSDLPCEPPSTATRHPGFDHPVSALTDVIVLYASSRQYGHWLWQQSNKCLHPLPDPRLIHEVPMQECGLLHSQPLLQHLQVFIKHLSNIGQPTACRPKIK